MSWCKVTFNKDSHFFKVRLLACDGSWHVEGSWCPCPSLSLCSCCSTRIHSVLAAGIGLCFLSFHTSGDNLLSWKRQSGLEKGCVCVHLWEFCPKPGAVTTNKAGRERESGRTEWNFFFPHIQVGDMKSSSWLNLCRCGWPGFLPGYGGSAPPGPAWKDPQWAVPLEWGQCCCLHKKPS